MRHDESSPCIIAQEKTQSDIKGQVINPSQASGDRLLFLGVEASGEWSQKVQQSDDSSWENPGHASGDRLLFQVPPGFLESRNQKRQIWKSTIGCRKESKMLRRLDATSPRIPMSRHRETDCSQKKMMTWQILLPQGTRFRDDERTVHKHHA